MIITKNLDRKFYNYIYPWGETLKFIAWMIGYSYHHTLVFTPVQEVFERDMLFNNMSIIDWHVITTNKQWQVDTSNGHKNYKGVRYGYTIENIIYMYKTII